MNDQKLSSHLTETLSALMDNQISELELQRILKATSEDAGLKATWDRYHLARAALKKDLIQVAPLDFAARVSASIAAEEKLDTHHSKDKVTILSSGSAVASLSDWWSNIGRVAVAASVACAVILGVQHMQNPSASTNNLVVENQNSISTQDEPGVILPSGINAPALTARTVALQSGFESKPHQNRQVAFVPRQSAQNVNPDEVSAYVNELMEVHSDNASRNSGQGVLPFTRVILTEDE